MTEPTWQVLPLAAEHTYSLADCHISCWREAYRDLVPAEFLEAFDIERRATQWERNRVRRPGRTWVAVADGVVIGFASGGPSTDDPPITPIELNALYVRSPWYGTGVAHELLRAALDPEIPCSLWVFQENPRAQAFYRKNGFELDGTHKVETFSPAMMVRMVRATRIG